MEALTPFENHIADTILNHTPPDKPTPDIYKTVYGTVLSPKGWWLLVGVSGPVWGHA